MSQCLDTITYYCDDVVGPDSADFTSALCPTTPLDVTASEQLSFTFDSDDYTDGTYPPGVYTFTIKGYSHTDNAGLLSKEATFTLTLVDPCAPPDSVTLGALSAQTVYPGAMTAAVDTTPTVTVVPSYCDTTITFTVTPQDNLGNASGAVTGNSDNDTFQVPKLDDLSLLTVTESGVTSVKDERLFDVVFTIVSGVGGDTVTATSSFVLTMKNPCILA